MSKRHAVCPAIDAVAFEPSAIILHHVLKGEGFRLRETANLYRCRDGSWTVRLVWRHREKGLTQNMTMRGLRP